MAATVKLVDALGSAGRANPDGVRILADGAVGIGERAEFHGKSRRAGSRLELAEDPGINLGRAFKKQHALEAFERACRIRSLQVVLHFL